MIAVLIYNDDWPIIDYDKCEFDLDLVELQVHSFCDEISGNDDNCWDVSVGQTSLPDTLAHWAVIHNELLAA